MKNYRILILLFIIVLSGCLPEIKNPLTVRGEQPLDEHLAGNWVKIGKKDSRGKRPDIYYNFSPSENRKYYVVKFWKIKDGVRKDDKVEMHIHTSRLKDKQYMNIKPYDPTKKEKAKGYLILKYKFEGRKMGFAITNIDPFREAVLQGKLKGTVPKYKRSDGTMVHSKYKVKVTASKRKLQKFFSKNDKKIFGDKFLFLERAK